MEIRLDNEYIRLLPNNTTQVWDDERGILMTVSGNLKNGGKLHVMWTYAKQPDSDYYFEADDEFLASYFDLVGPKIPSDEYLKRVSGKEFGEGRI